VLGAEAVHRLAALDAVARLERARLVVEPEWITPLLLPVWGSSFVSASSTTRRAVFCRAIAIAVASPTIPPPTMATSKGRWFTAAP